MDVQDRDLGQIVLATPSAAGLSDRLGIDDCCNGDRTLSLAELANHIGARYHRYLRQEVPSLLTLADKVLTVHGERHPELYEVHDLAYSLAEDVLAHVEVEERELSPGAQHHRWTP